MMVDSLGLFVTDRGAGPSVLFVHGQPGRGRDFTEVAALVSGDHRVVLVDRPGYGAVSTEAVSMVENAEILADALRSRGAAPATVVAHSYGGGVALLLADRHPELVTGLVLVGSIGRADSIGAFDRVLALPGVGEVMTVAGLVAFGRFLPRIRRLAKSAPGELGAWFASTLPDEGFMEVALSQGYPVWRSVVAEQRFLLREIALVEEAIDRVTVPTVVITGTRDVVVPPRTAVQIAVAVAGAELVTVARMGHFVHRDAPHVVAAAVRRVEGRATGSRAETAGA
ncbi:MAG TPA: alpha/beta hydrolase [Acidimicrobiales bacterium]|nr:alpha/beta hydrolase [Acidimicrobiales bacterium]